MRIGLVLAVTALVATSALAAMPSGMSDACKKNWADYEAARTPKAFAAGSRGCGWRWEGATGTLESAKQKALEACKRHAADCRIVDAK